LRTYANYRDLGIAQATNGMVRAHVIRFIPPCRPKEVSKRHYHDVEFQMIYVLKGWIKTELDGQGAIVMRAGSAWIQPPRIEHVVLDYSNDCEVLEVILPADFATVELEKPTSASRRQ
jgi:quercetin dioxygenase-like cupin family protein